MHRSFKVKISTAVEAKQAMRITGVMFHLKDLHCLHSLVEYTISVVAVGIFSSSVCFSERERRRLSMVPVIAVSY